MKLSDLKRADTTWVELRHPATGVQTGAAVEIYGVTTANFREATDAMRARGAALLRRFKDEDKIPTEETLKARRQFLADITKDWRGFTDDNEQTLAFTRAGVLELYEDPDITLQVTQELGAAANFMKGSSAG